MTDSNTPPPPDDGIPMAQLAYSREKPSKRKQTALRLALAGGAVTMMGVAGLVGLRQAKQYFFAQDRQHLYANMPVGMRSDISALPEHVNEVTDSNYMIVRAWLRSLPEADKNDVRERLFAMEFNTHEGHVMGQRLMEALKPTPLYGLPAMPAYSYIPSPSSGAYSSYPIIRSGLSAQSQIGLLTARSELLDTDVSTESTMFSESQIRQNPATMPAGDGTDHTRTLEREKRGPATRG